MHHSAGPVEHPPLLLSWCSGWPGKGQGFVCFSPGVLTRQPGKSDGLFPGILDSLVIRSDGLSAGVVDSLVNQMVCCLVFWIAW